MPTNSAPQLRVAEAQRAGAAGRRGAARRGCKSKGRCGACRQDAGSVQRNWSAAASSRATAWTPTRPAWRAQWPGMAQAQSGRRGRVPGGGARARVESLQATLNDTTLKAPIAGRVLYRLAGARRSAGGRRQGADAGGPGRHVRDDLSADREGRARLPSAARRASSLTACRGGDPARVSFVAARRSSRRARWKRGRARS